MADVSVRSIAPLSSQVSHSICYMTRAVNKVLQRNQKSCTSKSKLIISSFLLVSCLPVYFRKEQIILNPEMMAHFSTHYRCMS